MRHNHTKCPGAKTFEPAEDQVFRTSDVVFSCWVKRSVPNKNGGDGFALLNPSLLDLFAFIFVRFF